MDIAQLNDRMEIDHVVHVAADGTVTDASGVHAPELTVTVDADGQIPAEGDRDLVLCARDQGWDVLTGWSNQYMYSGPIMHASEYIGGNLAEHILATPGFWVALAPSVLVNHDCADDGEPCENCREIEDQGLDGWILAHKEA